MTAEELWNRFCREDHLSLDTPYTAWAFGGPDPDGLTALVLSGKKFATASLFEDYAAENEALPGDRDYSVLLDTRGNAVCVLRNYEVKVEPFSRVSEYHGYAEGEAGRDLASWRRIHEDFWKDDLKRLGIARVEDCHAVLEKFTVEYVLPDYDHDPEILDGLFLIEPNIRYAAEITAYRDEMIACGSSMDGCLSLKRMPDPREWVDYSYEWGDPLRELGPNGVRGTLLMLIRESDDRLVGMVQVRVMPEGHPRAFVGHIGYSIRPSERRKGYAKLLLKKSLRFLKYGRGIDRACLCALPENAASKRTIEANGGIPCGQVTDPEANVTLDNYVIDLGDL